MEIFFYSHANKTHCHKKGCAPSLILKVRVFGTRKWPILDTSSPQPDDKQDGGRSVRHIASDLFT